MSIIDTERQDIRAGKLEANNLNGFDFVLVDLVGDDPQARALLELHFLNAHHLAAILASSAAPARLFPISGGHRQRAGSVPGEVQVSGFGSHVSSSRAVAEAGIAAAETLAISVGSTALTLGLAAGSQISQIVEAVNVALEAAGAEAQAHNVAGRLVILAAKSFQLQVRSNRADLGDGSTIGFGTVDKKPSVEALSLLVEPVGDYSTYELGIEPGEAGLGATFDPVFDEISFKFRPGCFSTDCAPVRVPQAPAPATPAIDYLSKDYDSFRHVLMTWMQKRVPGWEPSSEVDLSQMILSLFSAAGDELSDFQDRVMREAYMATSRNRVSLARHARLMDYHVQQGNQASTWLAARLISGQVFDPATVPGHEKRIQVWAGRDELDEDAVVFQGKPGKLHHLVNQLSLYTWDGTRIGLDAGSSSADLAMSDKTAAETVRDLILGGEVTRLLIQEHRGPKNGHPAGADSAKRQILDLLTDETSAGQDPLTGEWFVHVKWRREDRLRYAYCFTVETETAEYSDVSLFHGNLIEVFHGRTAEAIFRQAPSAKDGFITGLGPKGKFDEVEKKASQLGISLAEDVARYIAGQAGSTAEEISGLLTLLHEVAAAEGKAISKGFAKRLLTQVYECEETEMGLDGHSRWGTICALPTDRPVLYRRTSLEQEGGPESTVEIEVDSKPWTEVISLIRSDEHDEHFAVETDELGRSVLRFGNGVYGENLQAHSFVYCRYQTGKPLDGNVGADQLIHSDRPELDSTWNPFDVANGRAPEPRDEIVRNAPEAYRARQMRAVTLSDYVDRTEEVDGVSRAAARYAWTGSWRTVRITVDPVGTDVLHPELRQAVARKLAPVRLIGEDLEIRPPIFVPLEVKVSLCVRPDVWPEDVRSSLDEEFSDSYTFDGRRGFFHPDEWTFGQRLRHSQILGRLELVPGVDRTISVSLKRFNAATPGNTEMIEVGPSEIFQVRNDPDHMEFGSIEFDLQGGRQ